tara:strand:- start:136 stop:435 length:300 start_codon:yes stop_codon:yes gene_type:complete
MDENAGLDAYKRNPDLGALVEVDTELKNWLVEYVGNKMANDSPDVTVEMIVNVVAEEFPEFMLAVAEENFMRGYEQALTDLQEVRKLEESDEEDNTEDI